MNQTSLASVANELRPSWAQRDRLKDNYAPTRKGAYWTIHQPNILASDAIISVYLETYLTALAHSLPARILIVDYDAISDSRTRTAHIPNFDSPSKTHHVSYPWRLHAENATTASEPLGLEVYVRDFHSFLMLCRDMACKIAEPWRSRGIHERAELLSDGNPRSAETVASLLFGSTQSILEFYGLEPNVQMGSAYWRRRKNELAVLQRDTRGLDAIAQELAVELAGHGIKSSLLNPGVASRVWALSKNGVRSTLHNDAGGILVPGVILDDLAEPSILRSRTTYIYHNSAEHYLVASELARRAHLAGPQVRIAPTLAPCLEQGSYGIREQFKDWLSNLDTGRYSHALRFLLWGDLIKESISSTISTGAFVQ